MRWGQNRFTQIGDSTAQKWAKACKLQGNDITWNNYDRSNPYHYGVWSWLFCFKCWRGRVKFTPWKHGEIKSMSKCISPHIFLLARVKILMDNGAAPKPGHSEWKRASRDFFPCARLVSPFVLSIFAPPINRPRPLDIEQTICALVIIANSIHLAVFSDMQIKTFVLQNLGMRRCRCSNGTCLFLERFLLPTEHEYPMISEIEVGICNFKWTKSVPIQQIKTFPLFAKKELIIDMHFKLQRLRKKKFWFFRGEVSEKDRLSHPSWVCSIIHKSPQIGHVSRLPIPLLTLLGHMIRTTYYQGLEIMDYFSNCFFRLGVPMMLLLQVDPKWRRLRSLGGGVF